MFATLRYRSGLITLSVLLCAAPWVASARPPFQADRNAFWRASRRAAKSAMPPTLETPPPSSPATPPEKQDLESGGARILAITQPVEKEGTAKEPQSAPGAESPALATPGAPPKGDPTAPPASPREKIKDEPQKVDAADKKNTTDPDKKEKKEDKKEDEKKEDEEKKEEDQLLFHGFHKFVEDNLGMTTTMQYVGQAYTNAHGGLSTNTSQYRGNFDFSLTADTQKLGLWDGGKFYLYTQNTHGKSLTAKQTGDYMFYSLLETYPDRDDVNQLGELWYEHQWGDGKLVARAGRLDGYLYFGYQELTEGFLNSSFTLIPPTTVPAWPFQVLGAYTKYRFDSGIELKAAVYDSWHVGPQYILNTVDDNGVVGFTELLIPSQIFGVPKEKYGSLRIGAWYDTQKLMTISVSDSQLVTGNYGFYLAAQQMLYVEESSKPGEINETARDINLAADELAAREKTKAAQGLAIFAQYGLAPADRNYLYQYYGAGLMYRGLFRGRDSDMLGIGIGTGLFGAQTYEVDGSTYETAIECFYRIQLTPNIVLQPDVQYIANSGGYGRDSFPVGLHFILTL